MAGTSTVPFPVHSKVSLAEVLPMVSGLSTSVDFWRASYPVLLVLVDPICPVLTCFDLTLWIFVFHILAGDFSMFRFIPAFECLGLCRFLSVFVDISHNRHSRLGQCRVNTS